jgi:hypothetical protein
MDKTMSWLLLVWVMSNDSGFPDPHEAIVFKSYTTEAACLKAGPTVEDAGHMYHVTYWACVPGGRGKP